jgi:hypothetical protein
MPWEWCANQSWPCLLLWFLSVTLDGSLRDRLERGESLRPEAIEIAAQRGKAGRIDCVDTTCAFRAIEHKTGILEHPQVLRDSRTGNREVAGQFPDSLWPFHKALEDGASGAVPQGFPWAYFVSNH